MNSNESREHKVKNEYKSMILEKITEQLNEHVQNVPEQFSSTDNFMDGCVIVMNTREAQDIQLEQSNLVDEGYPKPEHCKQMVGLYLEQVAMEKTGEESADEIAESFIQEFADYVCYRFKDATDLHDLSAVLKAVNEFSFWPPVYVMLNGVWFDTMQSLTD